MTKEKRKNIAKAMQRSFNKQPTEMSRREMKERLSYIPILLNRLEGKDTDDSYVKFAKKYWEDEKIRLEEILNV